MGIYSHLLVIVDLLLITWSHYINKKVCKSDESNVVGNVCDLRKIQKYNIIHT